MNVAVILVVAGPALAAALVLAGSDSAAAALTRRWLAAIGFEIGGGGAIALLVRVLRRGELGSRGFDVDVWRAGLVLGVLLVGATVLARRALDRYSTAVFLAAISAACASLLVADIATFGVLCFMTTIGFGLVSVMTGSGAGVRALWRFALSDLALIVGLVLVAHDGMRVPAIAHGGGAVALLIAVALRLGSIPGVAWLGACADVRDEAGMLALGAMRAQGILVAVWIATGRSEAATVMMVGGAIVAAWAARQCVLMSSAGSAHVALGWLALAGFGAGTPATILGAVMIVAAMFLGATLIFLGRERDAGSLSSGAAPLGAALPGVAIVASSMLARGLTDRPALVPAAACMLAGFWLALAAVAGMRASSHPRAHLAWAIVPAAAASVIAAVPALATSGVALPALTALHVPRALGAIPGAFPNDVGVIFAVAALGALFVPRGARAVERADVLPWRGSFASIRSLSAVRATLVIQVVTAGWVGVLLWAGIRRGFL